MMLKLKDIKSFLSAAPLIAALLAPLSTLLEIPALTQRWYTYYGGEVPDPAACLALSGVGLALNFIANVLLVVRFSAKNPRWFQPATTLSTFLWIVKTIVAVINLAIFGIHSRNGPGYSYDEGFWCEVSAAVFSGVIGVVLVLHYTFVYGGVDTKSVKVRVTGKHFMLSVSFLLFVIGVQALIYSRVESWSYFDGIYFSVVTMLTIGFGDNFVPTHTSTRILILPFAILTISQLANEVSMIIDFYSERAQTRRDKWRARYERVMRQEARRKNPRATLKQEVAMLEKIAEKEEMMAQLYDLLWSLGGLITFWVLGALVFSHAEGWTYGDALYFQVVFCLTIGYGDFTPASPGTKVFWVIYAIAAVPLIASFAVQTVTGLLSTFSQRRVDQERNSRQKVQSSEAFEEHAEFILRHQRTFTSMMKDNEKRRQDSKLARSESRRSRQSVHSREEIEEEESEVTKGEAEEKELIQNVLDHAVKLESISRQLIMGALPKGSLARTILEADRNLQLRDVEINGGDADRLANIWEEEEDLCDTSSEDQNDGHSRQRRLEDQTLDQVRRYRETFAGLLVMGAKLQRLQGDEAQRFERWLKDEVQESADAAGITEEPEEMDERQTDHHEWEHPDDREEEEAEAEAEDDYDAEEQAQGGDRGDQFDRPKKTPRRRRDEKDEENEKPLDPEVEEAEEKRLKHEFTADSDTTAA